MVGATVADQRVGRNGVFVFVRCKEDPPDLKRVGIMTSSRHITIFDTTLRDGEQSPGASMNMAEKKEVAQALVDLGVDVIEAGFPIASPGDFEAVREIARVIRPPARIQHLPGSPLHAGHRGRPGR